MTLSPLRLEISAVDRSPLPVDLTLIKAHCRIDTSDFDTVLQTYLFAAIAWAEGAMHRTIFARPHSWVLRDFPHKWPYEIRLPRGKTQVVSSVQYVSSGVVTTLAGGSASPIGADFQEDLRGDDGGVISPAAGSSWPSVDYDVPAPLVINFMAGWLPAEVPDEIIHALLFTISDAFDVAGSADMSGGANLQTRETLLSAYNLHRWY